MSSIKQLIKNAIIKVSSENPALNREGELSAVEARDMFIEALLAELFPEHGNETSASVEVPVVPPVPVKKPAKAASPKKTPEEKAAEKAAKKTPEEKAAEKAKKAAEKEAEKAAKKAAEKAAKDAEKAILVELKAAKKAVMKEADEAEKAEKKSSPKKAVDAALPASPKSDLNVPKMTPTWRKLLKEADKDHAKELEPELLKYLNNIANVMFNELPAKQHVANFLASRAPPPAEHAGPVDLEVVEFNGVEYYVNPETKRVYEGITNAEGELTITRPIGYVGMAEFKDMVLEDA